MLMLSCLLTACDEGVHDYIWPNDQERFSLPPDLMRHIVSLALEDWNYDEFSPLTSGIRVASKGLRDAFDAANTRIMMGGVEESRGWKGSKPPSWRGEEEFGKSFLGLLRRTPLLETLVFQAWLPEWSVESCFVALDDLKAKKLSVLFPNLLNLKVACDLCPSMYSLPSFVALLPFLNSMDLSGSDVHHLRGLRGCRVLEYLDCRECKELRSLASIPSLTSLSISGAENLESLSPLAACSSLASLDINFENFCRSDIQEVAPLGACASLTHLSLKGIDQATGFTAALSPLTDLVDLTIWSDSLEDVTFLPSLSHLRFLNLKTNCLRDLRGIGSCTGLEFLDLDLPWLDQGEEELADAIEGSKSSLRRVSLHCPRLDSRALHAMTLCSGLQRLELQECSHHPAPFDLGLLASCPDLQDLSLLQMEAGSFSFSSLSELTGLSALALGGALVTSAVLRDVSKSSQLSSLLLSECEGLRRVASLADCGTLLQLELRHCPNILDLWSYLMKSEGTLDRLSVMGGPYELKARRL